jgi:hypothetical protein
MIELHWSLLVAGAGVHLLVGYLARALSVK